MASVYDVEELKAITELYKVNVKTPVTCEGLFYYRRSCHEKPVNPRVKCKKLDV